MTTTPLTYPIGQRRQPGLEQHQPDGNSRTDKVACKTRSKGNRPENALELRLWAIAGEIKANMPEDVTSDHGWLYDNETGLPT